MSELRILVLESTTGARDEVDPKLFPEGFGMLRTMAREFSDAGFDVVVPLNRKLHHLAGWLDADVCGTVGEAVGRKPDAALVIAPERGGELERVTARLRNNGVPVLGAPEKAIRVSSNKWLTYLALRGKVRQPRTWRVRPDPGKPVLVKPVDGAGCEGIGFLQARPPTDGAIFQEFLSGVNASCCLLGGDGGVAVLSTNRQEISIDGCGFEYRGGEMPLDGDIGGACGDACSRAAGSLGLRGFCGVDVVFNGRPHVVDVNPRPTTSFVALSRVSRANLGELLVDAFNGGSIPSGRMTNGHSIFRIIRTKWDIAADAGLFDRLREIPGLVSPPLASGGWIRRGSSMMVLGSGGTAGGARRDLGRTVEKTLLAMGAGLDAVDWT